MRKLSDFFSNGEKRANVNDERFWSSFFSQFNKTKTGQNVTPATALNVSAVYACVKVLAETIASLPLNIYRMKGDNSKEIAKDHPLYQLLHYLPNNNNTAYEMLEFLVASLCLRGNSYAFIEKDGAENITGIYPLDPARMQCQIANGRIFYEYNHTDGKMQRFEQNEIWHIRGLSSDGLVGYSPISLAAEPIGMSMAAEGMGARFFQNDASPSGVIEAGMNLTEEGAKKLRESWQAAQTGDNKYKTAVLPAGFSWKQISLNNRDSQFLETRQFQIEEIARIYRVPPILIGHSNNTSTYASAEQFMLSFVTHTIRPWLVRIEQSISRCLFSEKERRKYKAEFKLDALLRGDTLSRFNAYAVARNWGWLSVNDIRALENLNPIEEGGDIYLQPLNMQEAGAVIPLPDPNKDPNVQEKTK